MKNLITLFLFVLPLLSYGQKDHCNRIKKNTDDNGVITFRSPDLKHLSALKQFKTDVYFGLHFHFSDDHQHFDANGGSIEFEDGTIIKNENMKVDCKQELTEISSGFANSSSGAHSGRYVIQGFFPITEENMVHFLSKKIKRIFLDKVPQNIPDKEACRIMEYLKCLRDMKP